MKVKTLIAHHNAYGKATAKKSGDEYEVPDGEARVLIDQQLVEPVTKARRGNPGDTAAASKPV